MTTRCRMGFGKNWLFITVRQTWTWTLLLWKTPSSQRSKENSTRGSVPTEKTNIYSTAAEIHNKISQLLLSLHLLINLSSRSDTSTILQSPSCVQWKNDGRGLRSQRFESWLSQSLTSDPEHVSICTSFPGKTDKNTCFAPLTGPRWGLKNTTYTAELSKL